MIFCYTHTSVSYSAIIREDSSCSRPENYKDPQPVIALMGGSSEQAVVRCYPQISPVKAQ